ncbi:MAG: fimbrillin family protein [Bacteroides sp.]|nr:fimbrillin family protein [Bacteroides sp.]
MKTELIYWMTGVAFLLAGCGGQSPLDTEPQDNTLKLRSVDMADDTYTRAGALGAGIPVNKISVYVTDKSNAALTDNALSVYELKSGTWSSDAPPKITVTQSNSNQVYAFFPSGSSVSNNSSGGHTIPVQVVADNFSVTLQTDYLYATPQTAYDGQRTVSFEMNHALSKVSFNILKSSSVTETLTLSKVETLSGTNRLQQGTSATMNINTGKLNGLASTGSLVLTGSTQLKTLQEQSNVSCLVAPHDGLGDETFVSSFNQGGRRVHRPCV